MSEPTDSSHPTEVAETNPSAGVAEIAPPSTVSEDTSPVIELFTHDVDRVFNLAMALATADDEEQSDLGDYFAQALQIYQDFMGSVADGTLCLRDEEAGVELVSARTTGPSGDVIRFFARPMARPEKKKKHRDEVDAGDDRGEKKKKKK
jgi:hypothetical protein